MPIWAVRLRWNNLGGSDINQIRVKDLCEGCGRNSAVQPAYIKGSENLTFSSDISYIANFNICDGAVPMLLDNLKNLVSRLLI
jgi:hypothetical protein